MANPCGIRRIEPFCAVTRKLPNSCHAGLHHTTFTSSCYIIPNSVRLHYSLLYWNSASKFLLFSTVYASMYDSRGHESHFWVNLQPFKHYRSVNDPVVSVHSYWSLMKSTEHFLWGDRFFWLKNFYLREKCCKWPDKTYY